MKPCIDKTEFRSITVKGTVFDHDVIIRPDGRVKTRKKKLSQAVYGTSHMISRQEAEYVWGQGAGPDCLIVGSGQYGNVAVSPDAAAYLEQRGAPWSCCRRRPCSMSGTRRRAGRWGCFT